ncbi:MAG: tetratricopeptide repeat protein, partial [Cyclobacteriaceae bacterium]
MTLGVVILSLAIQFNPLTDRNFEDYLSGFSRNSEVYPDSALFYARKMLDAGQQADDPFQIVRAEYALGYTYRYLNDYVAAIKHYQNSWRIARSHGFEERQMMATNGLGISMYRAGNYPEALRYLYRSLIIREKRGKPDELSTIYNNIGLVYLKLLNWQKAHEFFELALQQKDKLDVGDAAILVNLGVCLPYMGRIEDAHLRFAQFREVCKSGCSLNLWCDYYNALGGLHLNQEDLIGAGIYFKKALEISRQNRLTGHQEMAYDNLSTLHMDLGEYKQALHYSDSSMHLALQHNMPQRIQNNYRHKAELLTLLGET